MSARGKRLEWLAGERRLAAATLIERSGSALAGAGHIGAPTLAETAVSILAEIIATRAGRPGGPLGAGSGPIHAGSHTQ